MTPVLITCHSWVHQDQMARVFFSSIARLPSETPPALRPLRQEELNTLKVSPPPATLPAPFPCVTLAYRLSHFTFLLLLPPLAAQIQKKIPPRTLEPSKGGWQTCGAGIRVGTLPRQDPPKVAASPNGRGSGLGLPTSGPSRGVRRIAKPNGWGIGLALPHIWTLQKCSATLRGGD
jgi:hypothetical protein